MKTVSLFDGRELAELLTQTFNLDLQPYGLMVNSSVISDMLKVSLEDLIDEVSSWKDFIYHPDKGTVSFYSSSVTADRVFMSWLKSQVVLDDDLTDLIMTQSRVRTTQMIAILRQMTTPGNFPNLKTWDVYVVERHDYFIFAIDNYGDYRITEWEQQKAKEYDSEYGVLNLSLKRFIKLKRSSDPFGNEDEIDDLQTKM